MEGARLASSVLLRTPDKAKGEQGQHYRYLRAVRDENENDSDSDCGDTAQSAHRYRGQAEHPQHELAPGPDRFGALVMRPSRLLSSSYPATPPPPPPGPSSSSSLSRQKKKNLLSLSADRQLHCMQALCEEDLRAVIGGHEDLAERQQTLLENLHARLLDATQISEFHRKVTAKVTCDQVMHIRYLQYGYILTHAHALV